MSVILIDSYNMGSTPMVTIIIFVVELVMTLVATVTILISIMTVIITPKFASG
jgi:hypothetical protein